MIPKYKLQLSTFYVAYAVVLGSFLAIAPSIGAQTAVPSLVPSAVFLGIPGTFVPDATLAPINPAAMQWGEPSTFAYGMFDAKTEYEDSAGNKSNDTYDGSYGGLRWVGDTLSIGGEVIQLEEDGNGSYSADVANLALAIKVVDAVALGVGLNTSVHDTSSQTTSIDELLGGVSVNIDDQFFFGFSQGTETFNRDYDSSASSDFELERAVQKMGVGMRTGGKGMAWHLEYLTDSREPYKSTATGEFSDYDSQTFVVEVLWGSIVIGARSTSFDLDDDEGTLQSLDLGWANQEGWAIAARAEKNTAETSGGTDIETNVTSVTVAYQF